MAVPNPPPVDHLAPGELVEGDERAFGVVLPRDVRVERAIGDWVLAQGQVAIHPLTKYLRARLEGGSLDENDTFATFDHVHIPGRPGREFRVHIGQAPQGTRIEMHDITPPPAPDLPDEAARWKQVGLTPKGKILDPSHFE
jgi:hypothetical protein